MDAGSDGLYAAVDGSRWATNPTPTPRTKSPCFPYLCWMVWILYKVMKQRRIFIQKHQLFHYLRATTNIWKFSIVHFLKCRLPKPTKPWFMTNRVRFPLKLWRLILPLQDLGKSLSRCKLGSSVPGSSSTDIKTGPILESAIPTSVSWPKL